MLPEIEAVRGYPVIPCLHCGQTAPDGWWGVRDDDHVVGSVYVAKHRCAALDGDVIDTRQPRNLVLSRA